MLFTRAIAVCISGDAHGPKIVVTMEGLPHDLPLDIDAANQQLALRQQGAGSGPRMQMEHDQLQIVSGNWKSRTTGMPLCLEIPNRASNPEKGEVRVVARPGHADFAAFRRFKNPDLRCYVEGASARRTAGIVAAGGLCKPWLEALDIEVFAYVSRFAGIEAAPLPADAFPSLFEQREQNPLRMLDVRASQRAMERLESAREKGDTLGGKVRVLARGVPAGLGSYSSAFTRLDALLAANLVGIPAVKQVCFGDPNVFDLPGSDAHDRFDPASPSNRLSNRAGGIEGGISNGEALEMEVGFKPIPTLAKPLDGLDVRRMQVVPGVAVRSDLTAVVRGTIVVENLVRLVLFDALVAEGRITK